MSIQTPLLLLSKLLHLKSGKYSSIPWLWLLPPLLSKVSFVSTRLEDEMDYQLPLQLEPLPLSRDLLFSFPVVGSNLRLTIDQGSEKHILPFLKAGKWAKFINVLFVVNAGLWGGVLTHFTKLRYMPNEDPLILDRQRLYEERLSLKYGRMPYWSFPHTSRVTGKKSQFRRLPAAWMRASSAPLSHLKTLDMFLIRWMSQCLLKHPLRLLPRSFKTTTTPLRFVLEPLIEGTRVLGSSLITTQGPIEANNPLHTASFPRDKLRKTAAQETTGLTNADIDSGEEEDPLKNVTTEVRKLERIVKRIKRTESSQSYELDSLLSALRQPAVYDAQQFKPPSHFQSPLEEASHYFVC